jgi:hypothetical protein
MLYSENKHTWFFSYEYDSYDYNLKPKSNNSKKSIQPEDLFFN